MSRIYDMLQRAEANRRPQQEPEPVPAARTAHFLSVVNNKGGIGKSTIATNLAVYLRALHEDLPILVLSLDDQSPVDRMFRLDDELPGESLTEALRRGSLERAIRLGQYGIHYVPTCRRVSELKRELADPHDVRRALLRTHWRGLVIVDTKSDLELLTQGAMLASDLVLVPVTDHASLLEAERVFAWLEARDVPQERAKVLLSLIDLRVKYREGEQHDLLGLLLSEIRRRGHPLLQSYISRSPKVESLYSNPEGRAISVLHGAKGSPASEQFQQLAREVFAALPPLVAPAEQKVRVRLRGLTPAASAALPVEPFEIRTLPCRIGRENVAFPNELEIAHDPPWQVSRVHASLIERDGAIGVVDQGSRLGSAVDGRRIGGASGESGPLFFTGPRGVLTLGSANSPYVYEVAVDEPLSQPVRLVSKAREWLTS
jgi:cellulose biosynthesis protein BcsQ